MSTRRKVKQFDNPASFRLTYVRAVHLISVGAIKVHRSQLLPPLGWEFSASVNGVELLSAFFTSAESGISRTFPIQVQKSPKTEMHFSSFEFWNGHNVAPVRLILRHSGIGLSMRVCGLRRWRQCVW